MKNMLGWRTSNSGSKLDKKDLSNSYPTMTLLNTELLKLLPPERKTTVADAGGLYPEDDGFGQEADDDGD